MKCNEGGMQLEQTGVYSLSLGVCRRDVHEDV